MYEVWLYCADTGEDAFWQTMCTCDSEWKADEIRYALANTLYHVGNVRCGKRADRPTNAPFLGVR